MTVRRALSLAAILTAAAGTFLLAGRLYLGVKAQLAAILIEQAYAAHLEDGAAHRPWPWSDLTPIARLEVDRLGVTRTILSGAAGESLAFGLGHVSGTAPPAGDGNCAIGGHRDTWAAFMKRLRVGDEMTMETRDTRRSYRVASLAVVQESDLSALEPAEGSRLTLITCFPFGGLSRSTQRLIVVGKAIAAGDHRGQSRRRVETALREERRDPRRRVGITRYELDDARSDDVEGGGERSDDRGEGVEGDPSRGRHQEVGNVHWIEEIDIEVNVEVGGGAAARRGEDRSGVGEGVRIERHQAGAADVVGFGRIEIAGAGQSDLPGAQRQGNEVQQVRVSFPQKHPQNHAVKMSGGRRRRGVQIAMGIEPEQGEVASVALIEVGDRGELGAAGAANHEDRIGARGAHDVAGRSAVIKDRVVAKDP
jgi:sortase A